MVWMLLGDEVYGEHPPNDGCSSKKNLAYEGQERRQV